MDNSSSVTTDIDGQLSSTVQSKRSATTTTTKTTTTTTTTTTRLSDVIESNRVTTGRWNKECIVFVSDNQQSSSCLRFYQAHVALQQHRKWLGRAFLYSFSSPRTKEDEEWVENNNKYKATVSDKLSQSSTRTRTTNTTCATAKDKDESSTTRIQKTTTTNTSTVIAYIADNALPDFFFSVLAATDWNLDHTETEDDVIPILLLNTRWTTAEMVTVLQPSLSSHLSRTLLLYGPGYQTRAVTVAQELLSLLRQQQQHGSSPTNDTNSNHHVVCYKPIPEFVSLLCNTLSIISPSFPVDGANRNIQNDEKYDSFRKRLQEQQHHNDKNNYKNNYQEMNRTALILFTSGTTTGVKGVQLSHRALLIQAWAKLRDPCSFHSHTRVVASCVPFFHVGGLVNLLAVWLAGGTLLFRNHGGRGGEDIRGGGRGGGFDPKFVWNSIHHTHCNCNTLVVVPAMIHTLQQQQQSIANKNDTNKSNNKNNNQSVELVLLGGQSASPSTIEFLVQSFPQARIVQTYACTEAASSLTYLDVTMRERTTGQRGGIITSNTRTRDDQSMVDVPGDCVGKPPSHVEIALLPMMNDHQDKDDDKSRERRTTKPLAQPWQVGLIATKGPHLMNGYWKRSTITASSSSCSPKSIVNPSSLSSWYDPNNWFVTNDLGVQDRNGSLWFCGRASDTIRTGGETVLAQEVERILQQHSRIAEVAVFPIPNDRYGEIVTCAIVLTTAHSQNTATTTTTIPTSITRTTSDNIENELLSMNQLRTWCKEHGLAGYKCPRQVIFVPTLPRNSMGKVLKAQLKQYANKHINNTANHIRSSL